MENLQNENRSARVSNENTSAENVKSKVVESFFDPEPDPEVPPATIANQSESNEKVLRLGIIESNRQIIRNESGQTIHKPYLGSYEEKPLKDSSSADITPEKRTPWFAISAFVFAVVLAIVELLVIVF